MLVKRSGETPLHTKQRLDPKVEPERATEKAPTQAEWETQRDIWLTSGDGSRQMDQLLRACEDFNSISRDNGAGHVLTAMAHHMFHQYGLFAIASF